jgi:hypothetical protein
MALASTKIVIFLVPSGTHDHIVLFKILRRFEIRLRLSYGMGLTIISHLPVQGLTGSHTHRNLDYKEKELDRTLQTTALDTAETQSGRS